MDVVFRVEQMVPTKTAIIFNKRLKSASSFMRRLHTLPASPCIAQHASRSEGAAGCQLEDRSPVAVTDIQRPLSSSLLRVVYQNPLTEDQNTLDRELHPYITPMYPLTPKPLNPVYLKPQSTQPSYPAQDRYELHKADTIGV